MSTSQPQRARRVVTYVVVVQTPGRIASAVYGPYRSFKRAEGDARAWEADGSSCAVEPIMSPTTKM